MARSDLVEKYRRVLGQLLPLGFVFDQVREHPLLRALATEFARLDERARQFLYVELNPARTDEMLDEWERLLGLPDEASPPALTVAERRAQVTQKIAALGGISAGYYEFLAERLGVKIKVQTPRPFIVGHSSVGEPLISGDTWANWWIVEYAGDFSAGSEAGRDLRELLPVQVRNTLKKYKPADSDIFFTTV
jgi:uncharacterized protein YmfQ (DUF2313 family)